MARGNKHSSREGVWEAHSIFIYRALDEAGTLDYFETDQTKTDQPTLYFVSVTRPSLLKSGLVHRIHYRLNPTNAVTYTLRIWVYNSTDDYYSNACMIYESPSAQADDTDYDRCELNIPFILALSGRMYYSIDWSGTPGNTTGFIEVAGERIT